MPEFQNRYGTGDLLSNTSSVEKSWGHKLNSSNYMGYSPVDDFYKRELLRPKLLLFLQEQNVIKLTFLQVQ